MVLESMQSVRGGMKRVDKHRDVYLSCCRCLKPDMGKKAKNKTQIKKKTLNPEFNEVSSQLYFCTNRTSSPSPDL